MIVKMSDLPIKQLTFFCVLSLLIVACSYRSKVDKKGIVGKYINSYEKGATHYIELFADSSFLHYYKNHDEVAENRGQWKVHTNDSNVEVSFKNWKSMGAYKEEQCANGCLAFIKLKDGEFVFDADQPNERNFRKIN